MEAKGYRTLKAFKKIIWWLISISVFIATVLIIASDWRAIGPWLSLGKAFALGMLLALLKFCYDQAWKGIVDEN